MNQYCSFCGPEKPYQSSDFLCPIHTTSLQAYVPSQGPEAAAADSGAPGADDTRLAPDPPDAPSSVEAAVSGRPWTTLVCWNCGEKSANPGNSECLECRKRLIPPRLVLQFKLGTVELDLGESVELGREGRYADLFGSFPNVSRRHAAFGVELDGRAWIEPRPTPNGTFRGADGEELDPEVRHPLQPDDQLRLALHAKATVILYALPDS
jgi:hypothetical protein